MSSRSSMFWPSSESKGGLTPDPGFGPGTFESPKSQ